MTAIASPVARLRSRDPKIVQTVRDNKDVLSMPSIACSLSATPPGHMVILSLYTDVEKWVEEMKKRVGDIIDPVSGSNGEKFSLM